MDGKIFVFRICTWTISSGIICAIWDPFMVPWIIYHVSVLESERSVAIKLKMALFDLNISLPALILEFIKLYYLLVILVFTYETNACKFSTSFNFCGKERFCHIVDIPIILIKPEASFRRDLVKKLSLSLSLTCMA